MADVIHATLQQVQNLSTGIGRVLRDHQRRLKILEERGGQTNVLEAVLVNGTQLIPNAAKAVNILVPAKVSDLTNDKKFQENVIEQVLVNGVKMPVDDKKRVTVTLPTQTSNLQNDAGYQTSAEVLAAIKANAYVHPSHTAYGSGLYKIVVDNLGHVTSAAKAVKSDITALGIPGQDTVYTHPGYTGHGLGLYKLAVDGQGHVSSVAGVTKGDITALGIPGQDTNSWRGIQNNLSSDSTSDSLSAAMGKALNTSLNDAITRIATCEQKIKAIGGVTEVFLRSLTYKAGAELCGSTVTLATMAADVAFVRFESGNTGSKLLRGSSVYKYAQIYCHSTNDWPSNRILVTFNSDGRITATDDEKLYLLSTYDKNSLSYVGTMYCYQYAV